MRPLLVLALVFAVPAFATSLDGKKLERLLGLGRTTPVPRIEVTPSPLPWRLLGTMRGREGFSIAAVDCASKSVTLAVGDVRDGVEVVSIEQQVLIVRREGRLEQIGWKAGVPSVVLPAARSISRKVVEQALQNPAALMEQAQLLPALVAGKLSGFRARWVKEGSLVASLGLKAGDVIMKVNGQPLDTMERVFSLVQLLTSARRFDVELERNGQRLVESVELDR
ncbi:MAG: PDZ domain-containing protein [Archangium sp.]|nr:PDZ domain-containing protein [Archangium sp.]MDP3570998.1 PDZ domain-containing protein [Archangium sp.]